MKKGFFLMAALASLFNNKSVGGFNIHAGNKSLKNAPPHGSNGRRVPTVTNILTNKVKAEKRKRRIVKRSRNINHKKAA